MDSLLASPVTLGLLVLNVIASLIAFRSELPHTDTGKLLRRAVLADLEKETS